MHSRVTGELMCQGGPGLSNRASSHYDEVHWFITVNVVSVETFDTNPTENLIVRNLD